MSYMKSFIRARLALKTQLSFKKTELEMAESHLKFTLTKEKEAFESEELYKYGYWYGLRSCTEDSIRSLNREIDRLKKELKEVEEDEPFPVTV
jgi:hypothetical protein